MLELGSACKRFGQSLSDACLYEDLVKHLAQLVEHVYGLLEDGATVEKKKNTLLIDGMSYKNIKNNSFSVVHPLTCILHLKRALQNEKHSYLIEFLQLLKRF